MASMTKGYKTPPRKAAENSETKKPSKMYDEKFGPPEFKASDYYMNQFNELINTRTGQEATEAEERMWFRSRRKK